MKILVSSFSVMSLLNEKYDNIKLINNFVDEGNMFIIATSKNISEVSKELINTNLKCSYFICNDGASIYDQYFNIIHRIDIDRKFIKPIYEALLSSNIISDVKIDVSTGFVDDYNRSANKIIAKYNNYNKALKLANILNEHYKELNTYISSNYLNIINENVSKGNSLKFLLDYYNLSNNLIYTVSKNNQDLSLKDYESFIIDSDDNSFKYHVSSIKEVLEEIANH